ncbi:MAG: FliM/FliN family flagellar motor switch protein [Candidatus Margulisiibacteriota bacterium]
MSNKSSEIKKEIFLPSIIGDWTTYTAEKNKASISITKSIGSSNKTISESTIENLLFFHQELFESFIHKLIQNIDTHIVMDTVSINVLNHTIFKEAQKTDLYICKLHHSELEQIDFLLSKKATKFIAHRLCGGANVPENIDPSELEVSIISIINTLFFNELTSKWRHIFDFNAQHLNASYGSYHFQPQQHESETIIEISCQFKMFDHHDLSCKIIYSLSTIQKLISYFDQLNDNIIERTFLTKETLKKTHVNLTSTIGTTTLSLKEIQNLEIGDVVLIEDKKLNDPIKMIIDDNISFNVLPVCINENEIGIQIINTPIYDRYIQKTQLPDSGPLITSTLPTVETPSKPHTQQALTPEPTFEQTPEPITSEINEMTNDISEISEPEEVQENEQDTMPETLDTTSQPTPTDESGGDDDDFSWDDLDDE